MSKGVKLFWGIVALAALILIVILARTPSSKDLSSSMLPAGTITVGVVLPLTGDRAAYGISINRAAEIAVEEINATGGIGGRQVRVVLEDGKCEEKEATAAAQKLINLDQVKVIFGGVCSSETLAMAPLAEAASVLVVSPSSTRPDITTAGDFIFRTAPSDTAAGGVAAQYAYEKMTAKRAAIISQINDHTQGLRKVFKEKFSALGGEIVADETYNTADIDMRAQILKIKAANPDVIYILPQTPAQGVLLLKQLAANGVTAKRLTAEVMLNSNIVAENKAILEGLTGIETWFDEQGEAASMLAKYKEKYNEPAAFASFQANMYSQFYLLKEAVEKTESMDTEKIRDYFYAIKDWKHALGSLTFDANGDPVGLPYSVKQVTSGELKELEIYRRAVQ
ncbi:MAG: ABC transporter substrate-binding protein [bacterium]|nr:ABC transporter substrate-binding protein [bacterium]